MALGRRLPDVAGGAVGAQRAAVKTIAVRQEEKHPFSDEQIALLRTFADQAVIAIENVRLFKEAASADARR